MNEPDFDALEDRIKRAKKDSLGETKSSGNRKMDDNTRAGMQAGVEFVGAILLSAFIGFQIDKFFGTMPLFFISLLLLGIGTGFYNVYRITQNMGTGVGNSQLHSRGKNATTTPDNTESK